MRPPRIIARLAPSLFVVMFATLLTACPDLGPKAKWHTRESAIVSSTQQYYDCAELDYEAPSGLTQNGEYSSVYVRSGQQCLALGYEPNGSLGSGDKRFLGPNGGTKPAPRGYFAAGDGAGNAGSGGAALNLVCPGSLPSGYQCLSTGGQQAPGRYNIAALHATWVDNSLQACMTLNSDGSSSFRYKSGAPSTTGRWGALVTKTGAFSPASGPYYVFTGSTDPQIMLLSFDASAGKFVGYGFAKGGCPW